eukprot:Hpha_TRINITY_DN3706_c0_g1::TRINITY_DN3706_c0_g1_i1::g.23822::m.23822
MEAFQKFRLTASLLPPGDEDSPVQAEKPPRFFMQNMSGPAGAVLNCCTSPVCSDEGEGPDPTEIVRCLSGDCPVPLLNPRDPLRRGRFNLTCSLTTNAYNSLELEASRKLVRRSAAGARSGAKAIKLYGSLPGHRLRKADPLCEVGYFARNCWSTEMRKEVPSTVERRVHDEPPSPPAAPLSRPPPLVPRQRGVSARLRRLREKRSLLSRPLSAPPSLGMATLTRGSSPSPRGTSPPVRPRFRAPEVTALTGLMEHLLLRHPSDPRRPPRRREGEEDRLRAKRQAAAQARRVRGLENSRRYARHGLRRLEDDDPRVASRAIIY